MVDEHGEPGSLTGGAATTDEERQQERAALDDIEVALLDVAAVLARMG